MDLLENFGQLRQAAEQLEASAASQPAKAGALLERALRMRPYSKEVSTRLLTTLLAAQPTHPRAADLKQRLRLLNEGELAGPRPAGARPEVPPCAGSACAAGVFWPAVK